MRIVGGENPPVPLLVMADLLDKDDDRYNSARIYVNVSVDCSRLGGSMRIYMYAASCIVALSLLTVTPTFSQAPAKPTGKSITVYKTPT
jgi:hypothetical protein